MWVVTEFNEGTGGTRLLPGSHREPLDLLFAYTAADEWGGAKVRIPLEDDAIVTERGVEWLYPVNERILLIK